MASAARVSLITAEELLERPDDDFKYELDGGGVLPGLRCPVRRLFASTIEGLGRVLS